jgi:hypothetical protein
VIIAYRENLVWEIGLWQRLYADWVVRDERRGAVVRLSHQQYAMPFAPPRRKFKAEARARALVHRRKIPMQ